MADPCKQAAAQLGEDPMRGNCVQRIVQPDPCLCQKVWGRLYDGKQRQALIQLVQCFQFTAAVIAFIQMLLQRDRIFIRQLAIACQKDVLFCGFALHRPTSTSLKNLLPLSGLYSPPVVCCNCLLYTSPSPRDRQKSRMPSSA